MLQILFLLVAIVCIFVPIGMMLGFRFADPNDPNSPTFFDRLPGAFFNLAIFIIVCFLLVLCFPNYTPERRNFFNNNMREPGTAFTYRYA
jgi:polyferredoxin